MDKLFEKLKSLPRPVLVMLVVIIFSALIFGVVKSFLPKKSSEDSNAEFVNKLNSDFPDATVNENENSIFSQFEDSKINSNTVNDYWNSLDNNGQQTGGLMVDGSGNDPSMGPNGKSGYNGEYLDPTVYSEFEIAQIKRNITTKEAVDEMHRQREALLMGPKTDEISAKRKAEIEDSMYFARMERTYAMAAKYMAPKETPAPEPVKITELEIPKEPEPRTIDINQDSKTLETVEFNEGGIIESWDDFETQEPGEHRMSGFKAVPVRATFLKNETVTSGQRVSIRLMQDLLLSDGTKIPSNTHIKGICEVSSRLNIKITAISYSGKIYYVDISAYDNDGTEGIYCPTIISSKSKKVAKQVTKDAVSGVAGVAGTVFGNALIGRMAQSGVNGVSQFIDDDGNMNVAISSGYEFYIYENIKEDK